VVSRWKGHYRQFGCLTTPRTEPNVERTEMANYSKNSKNSRSKHEKRLRLSFEKDMNKKKICQNSSEVYQQKRKKEIYP
jgi:hypothetical protein